MAAITSSWYPATTRRTYSPADSRRKLQLALAGVWLYAGLLQAQSYMFTRGFSTQMLDGAAEGNPHWLASTINWNAHLLASQPLLWNLFFMLIQVALGLGIACRPTVKFALGASIAWAIMVWWLGEGFGGLLTGQASAISGAPGAVILYALLAVLLWPTDRPSPSEHPSFIAAQAIGAPAARSIWVLLWGGLALLNLQPANGGPDGISNLISGNGKGQPAWISTTIQGFSDASQGHGVWLTAVGTSLLVLIAVGIFFSPRVARSAIIAGAAVATLIWLIGEALGAPFGGQATDPNSGPLLLIIAAAFWPLTKGARDKESEAGRS